MTMTGKAKTWVTIGRAAWGANFLTNFNARDCAETVVQYLHPRLAVVPMPAIVIKEPQYKFEFDKREEDWYREDLRCIIEPWLYLSGLAGVRSRDLVAVHGVRCIISVGLRLSEMDTKHHGVITNPYFALEDEERAPLKDVLLPVCLLLEKNEAAGIRTLIHCQMGISRSASCVIGFFMRKLGRAIGWNNARTHQERIFALARELVLSKRTCVRPNPGFANTLRTDHTFMVQQ